MSAFDHCQRFVFEASNIRGEIVQLENSWQAVLQHHQYPGNVRQKLGECVAAALLLGSTLKYEGSITLQIQGNGEIKLLVVQVTSKRTFRAVAEYDAATVSDDLQQLFGNANLVITLESERHKERYQSIIELNQESISAAINEYFSKSVQLKTELWLACDGSRAAGLLVQEMPGVAGVNTDADLWDRVVTLSNTITADELLNLQVRMILHRLYNEEDVRLFDADSIRHFCPCSREKITMSLISLGKNELDDIIKEMGSIEVTCEFCRCEYSFDKIDVETMFTEKIVSVQSDTTH